MWTPLPWTSSPRLWPVRWMNCAPNPARSITARHAWSTCQPRSSRPLRADSCTSVTAASRASRTVVNAFTYRSGAGAPVNPTQVPHRVDRARIDARHVRDRVARRILHGDPLRPGEQILEAAGELIALAVDAFAPGQVIQIVRLDRVDEFLRLAGRGNQVVPAAGGHLRAVVEAGQPPRNRVRSVEVVQQPGVEPILF